MEHQAMQTLMGKIPSRGLSSPNHSDCQSACGSRAIRLLPSFTWKMRLLEDAVRLSLRAEMEQGRRKGKKDHVPPSVLGFL